MENIQTITLLIFIITYCGIIFTRLPGVNIDRPSAAFSGAVAMVIFGILTPLEAIQAIDFNTIILLLGMMMVIATLQLDGFFTLIANQTIRWSTSRFKLLTVITFITGISSAFLVNDAVVLMFTPVIILICRSLKINAIPYLVAEILASNIGSAMTITGNPQNMLIGLQSGISYTAFLLHLLPVSILGMVLIVWTVRLVYRKEFSNKQPFEPIPAEPVNIQKVLRSGLVFLLVILGFFFGKQLGLSIPLIGITGGALILLLGEVKPSLVIQKVDWVLLLFFASLFIVVAAVEKVGLLDNLIQNQLLKADLTGMVHVHLGSLFMSQIVSNVPFVVLMLPLLKTLDSSLLWLALASASTLAGNATIIGAMANLIVIETAEKQGIKICFLEFMKAGLLVTLISLPLSVGILYVQQLLGWIQP